MTQAKTPTSVGLLGAALTARRVLDRCRRRALGGPQDRGDVPGWVLVTIMTAGLVVGLWAIAGPKLGELFTTAVSSVTGP